MSQAKVIWSKLDLGYFFWLHKWLRRNRQLIRIELDSPKRGTSQVLKNLKTDSIIQYNSKKISINMQYEQFMIIYTINFNRCSFYISFIMENLDEVKIEVEMSLSEDNSEPAENEQSNKQQQQRILSKKQQKKLIKKEKWEKQKLIKRKQKRQKEKQKKKMKKQALPVQQIKQQSEAHFNLTQEQLLRKRKDDYQQKMKEGLRVVIDLQFYDLMVDKQKNSLVKQLSYCHSVNRKQQKCFSYILTSATDQRQKTLSDRYNADKWGINMETSSLLDLFPKQKIVYLTGDANEDIEEFNPELIYIIGGIVDHNRMKKITYNFALEHGISAKRLPMGNVQLKASVHLAVNHVWQWMLRRYNGATWEEAIKAVIPLRKLQNQEKE